MADAIRKAVNGNSHVHKVTHGEGELWTIPGTNSSIEFLVSKEQAPFAVVHSRSMPDAPVPPHFHKMAIDTWLVLQGKLNVWFGDEGRVLSAGDFAYVPPGVVHSYQVLEPHTEFMGVIHPSEWVDFFRAIGEKYTGASPFPSTDDRHFPVQKFIKAIQDGHDVVPLRDHKLGEAQAVWSDSELPEAGKAYALKAHRGPRYQLGGLTCSPLCTNKTTNGKFSMSYIEGSSSIPHPSELATIKFNKACVSITVLAGKWEIVIEGDTSVLAAGESVFVPAGQAYSLKAVTRFARLLAVAGEGSGPEILFEAAGQKIEGIVGSVSSELTDECKNKMLDAAKTNDIEVLGLSETSGIVSGLNGTHIA